MAAFSRTQLATLQAEKDTDPDVRGYAGMTDQQFADDVNLARIDIPADPTALLDYMLSNEHRGGTIYGRVSMVAKAQASAVGDYGTLPLDTSDGQISIEQKHVASSTSLLRMVGAEAQITTPVTTAAIDAALDNLAGGAGNAQCMGPAHKTAILALSENLQSRAGQLGLPHVPVSQVGRLT